MNNVTEINEVVNFNTESKRQEITRIARGYYDAGLNVLPLAPGKKHPPQIKWGVWKEERMTSEEHDRIFAQFDASHGIGLVMGKGSGGAEAIDIDTKHDPGDIVYTEYKSKIISLPFFAKLVKQKTKNEGRHLLFRCPNPKPNTNLAKAEGSNSCAIETRGQGGFLVLSPTEGYEVNEGSPGIVEIPFISDQERDVLHELAKSCCKEPKNDAVAQKTKQKTTTGGSGVKHTEPELAAFGYPASFNQQINPREYLIKAGWTSAGVVDKKEQYRRPGKTDQGVSANWDDECKVFYVHTTGSSLPEGALTSFQVFAYLEHGGNLGLAAESAKKILTEVDDMPLLITGKDLPKTKGELDARKPPEVIPGLLFKGGSMAIGGAVKASKSIMVGNFINAAVTGTSFIDKKIPRLKVLLIDLEVDFWELSRRFFGMTRKDENGVAQYSENLFILSLRKRPDLRDRTKLAQLVESLKEEHKFDLIVLDCAYQIMGGIDENANAQMTELGHFFSALQKDETTLIVVHHFGKGDSYTKNVWDRFRGASSFGALFDACIVLAAHKKDDHLIAEFGARSFRGDPAMVLKFDPFPNLMIAEGEDSKSYRKAGQLAVEDDPVIASIRVNPTWGTKQLGSHFGLSPQAIRDRAEKAGLKSVKKDGSTYWMAEENGQLVILEPITEKSVK